MRGIYWREMPGYVDRNTLDAGQPLPAFYWTGETESRLPARNAIGQTLALGYAHHIQRLMVTGSLRAPLGRPTAGGARVVSGRLRRRGRVGRAAEHARACRSTPTAALLASKPYVATGKYLARMSNYCAGCRYRPDRAHGADACPFTTLYWDFLARHRERFARHPRLALQVRNLERLSATERTAIAARADELRRLLDPA